MQIAPYIKYYFYMYTKLNSLLIYGLFVLVTSRLALLVQPIKLENSIVILELSILENHLIIKKNSQSSMKYLY